MCPDRICQITLIGMTGRQIRLAVVTTVSVRSRAAIKRTRVQTSHFQVISHRVMERRESARLDRY
jgi:hypothetical protein